MHLYDSKYDNEYFEFGLFLKNSLKNWTSSALVRAKSYPPGDVYSIHTSVAPTREH